VSTDDKSTVAAAPDTGPNGRSTPADAVINRLNAFDGLFLRAEHLNRMQAYTLRLSAALGRALGSGVVEGFGIGFYGDTLVADPGLAIDPAGRPLRTRQPLRRSLSNLTPNADSVWWIELHLDEQEFGDEPIRGVSCTDPCQGCGDGSGAGQHPYIAEGVRLNLREEKLPTPADLASLDRRGVVAQQVFDRERPPLGVWPGIPPTSSSTPQFLERRWHPLPADRGEGTGRPDDAVPIGLLLPSTEPARTWEIDVWTVRRDLGEIRSQQAWLPPLGMRPWSVFVAQILQFQQLLADRLGAGAGSAMTVADINRFLGLLTDELKSRRTAKPLEITTEFQERLRGIAANQVAQAATLPQLGLRWLPPALFLPVAQELPWPGDSGLSVRDEVIRKLDRTGDGHLKPVFCTCGPWDIGRALEFARHADRIDLVDKQIPLRVFVPFTGNGRLTDWVLVVADARVSCPEFKPDPGSPQ
jgi:hypothetical protein